MRGPCRRMATGLVLLVGAAESIAEPVPLAEVNTEWTEQDPWLSPDGYMLYFSSDRDGGDFDIYVMNADGTGVTQLTQSTTYDFFEPSWSPNGRQIGFCGNGVSVMNGDGTGITQLIDDGCLVVWSPNGRQIAFNSNRDGDEEVYGRDLEGGTMATTMHRGPYEEIGLAYQSLMSWIAENGYEIAGPPREFYLNDPRVVAPLELLTRIEWPVCAAAPK